MEKKIRGFKTKTIEKIIHRKMEEWIGSIKLDDKEKNEKFKDEIRDSYIVTGGAIASMLQGELPNDFDVYFNNTKTAKKVADYYLSKLDIKDNSKFSTVEAKEEDGRVSVYIGSAGVAGEDTNLDRYEYFEFYSAQRITQYFEQNLNSPKSHKGDYKLLLASSNALTLTDDVQLILRFVGLPEEIHKNYDFIHCTNYFTNKGGLVLNKDALVSIMTKELKYVGSKYPLCSMFRIRKFIGRGWTITAGEQFKIAYDIAHLNLNDINVLKDQLIGVDAAYFIQFLSLLKEETKRKESIGDKTPFDRTYLFEMINRVFDNDEDLEYGESTDSMGGEISS